MTKATIIEAHGEQFALVGQDGAELAARHGYAPLNKHEVFVLKAATKGQELDADMVKALACAKRVFPDGEIVWALRRDKYKPNKRG